MADPLDGLKFFQQQPTTAGTDTFDSFQGKSGAALLAKLAAITAGKAMGLILNGCQQTQQCQLFGMVET